MCMRARYPLTSCCPISTNDILYGGGGGGGGGGVNCSNAVLKQTMYFLWPVTIVMIPILL